MRNPKDDYDTAVRKFKQFVANQTAKALELANRARTDEKRRCKLIEQALRELGRAIHADADKMSPVHGMQPWPGLVGSVLQEGLIDTIRESMEHVGAENNEAFSEHSDAVVTAISAKYGPLMEQILGGCSK